MLGGGVPGAGGFDALWLLLLEPRQQQQYAPAQYQQQNLDNYDCDEYSDSAGYYDMNYADCLDSMDEDMEEE